MPDPQQPPAEPASDSSSEPDAAQLVADNEYGARRFPGAWRWLLIGIAVSWSLFQLAIADFLLLNADTVRCVHLAFAIVLVFLCFPAVRPHGRVGRRLQGIPGLRLLTRTERPPVYDLLLGVLAAGLSLYYLIDYEGIAARQGQPNQVDLLCGVGLIIILLEAARRALGPALPVVAAVFILISFTSEWLGPLAWKAASLDKMVGKVALGTEGILGVPLDVSANTVFLFVLFGAMLDKAGAGSWFIDLAFSLVGRFRGGAAKAAVLASGFTGIISGSSIANTVTTGTFTIPLMKRAGYPAVKAGAIEVAASTNGQLMPPIMGAAAFIIAEYCNLSFVAVITAAAIPAIISYLALLYITHLEACKLGLSGTPASELPRFIETLRSGLAYLFPLGLLIYFLMIARQSPQKSALYAIIALAMVIVGRECWRAWKGQQSWKHSCQASVLSLGDGLFAGARNMMGIAVAVAAAGIIVGVVTMGLGGKIVESIAFLSGGNLMLMLLITAGASLLLGMGLPTTANYIVMATLTVPVIMELGAAQGLLVPAIAAHLFCFYFGILADDTPPVGLAAYAAAAISKADPIKTGVQGFTYDMRTAILPFMFLFNTELLLLGVDSIWYGALIAITGLVAMLAFANATQRWLLLKTTWYEIILLLVVTVLLLRPDMLGNYLADARWPSYVIGVALYGALILWHRWRRQRLATSTAD